MSLKVERIVLMFLVSAFLAVQPSNCLPSENEKLIQLSERFDKLQTKVESLEAENEELKIQVDSLQIKVYHLEGKDIEKEAKIREQEEEIIKLEAKMDVQLGFIYSSKPSRDELETDIRSPNDKPIGSIYRKEGSSDDSSTRATVPSSCRELSLIGHSLDVLYLVPNRETKKVETVLCIFGTLISQDLIGHVDIKTKTTHFYVQRDTDFGPGGGAIPFELARINEGGAFDLPSGIFTVPVPGIYHFDFSAVKYINSFYIVIYLQVNGITVGTTFTEDTNVNKDKSVVSLSASLRLEAGDRVRLFNSGDGVLHKNGWNLSNFAGWLVEEELM